MDVGGVEGPTLLTPEINLVGLRQRDIIQLNPFLKSSTTLDQNLRENSTITLLLFHKALLYRPVPLCGHGNSTVDLRGWLFPKFLPILLRSLPSVVTMTRATLRQFPFTTNLPMNKIIGGPETLRWVNPTPAPGTERAFMMMYANHRAYTYTSQSMKIGHEGPFKKYFAHAWAQRQEPLWTCFVTTKFKGQEAKIKRTMRSWVVRRVRIAFMESMKRHGFTKDGEPLKRCESMAPLCGTVQFVAQEHIVKMKMEEVAHQMDFCVKKMIDKQRPGNEVKPVPSSNPWKKKKGFHQPSLLKSQKK